MKNEAGVTAHTVNEENLVGLAYIGTGGIGLQPRFRQGFAFHNFGVYSSCINHDHRCRFRSEKPAFLMAKVVPRPMKIRARVKFAIRAWN